MAYNKNSKCKSKYAIGTPKGKTPSRSCYLRKGVLFSAYGPSAIRQATCNGDDRRQWRKQGGAVGAAASRMRAAAKQTLGAATRRIQRVEIAGAFLVLFWHAKENLALPQQRSIPAPPARETAQRKPSPASAVKCSTPHARKNKKQKPPHCKQCGGR